MFIGIEYQIFSNILNRRFPKFKYLYSNLG